MPIDPRVEPVDLRVATERASAEQAFRERQQTQPDRERDTLTPGPRLPLAERLVLRDLARMDPSRQAAASEIMTTLTQMEGRDVEVVLALSKSLAAHARRGRR